MLGARRVVEAAFLGRCITRVREDDGGVRGRGWGSGGGQSVGRGKEVGFLPSLLLLLLRFESVYWPWPCVDKVWFLIVGLV
jgi:hypothetical protein